MCGRNLYFSSRNRSFAILLGCLAASTALAQLRPMDHPEASNIFPSAGAQPELLTVFDMRKDADPADRILAQSAEGLMNSDPVRTDKIYLILNDQDKTWLDWLVSQQYVSSISEVHDMGELLRRYPNRDAILCSQDDINVGATVAGCEKLLLVTDRNLISRFHLNVKK